MGLGRAGFKVFPHGLPKTNIKNQKTEIKIMKRIKKLAGLMVVTVGLLGRPAAVQASPGWYNGIFTLPTQLTLSYTNINTSTPTNIVATNAAAAYTLQPGVPLLLWINTSVQTSAQATNHIVGFDVYNGQVWSTTQPITVTNANLTPNNYSIPGNSNIVVNYIVPAASLYGCTQIRVGSFTLTGQQTNGVLNAVGYSQYY
jgi:hypothetical protein